MMFFFCFDYFQIFVFNIWTQHDAIVVNTFHYYVCLYFNAKLMFHRFLFVNFTINLLIQLFVVLFNIYIYIYRLRQMRRHI